MAKSLKFTTHQKKYLTTYPVEQRVMVPSTKDVNKPISASAHKKRVLQVRNYLSRTFGGDTAISGSGGYYSTDKHKLVREPVTVVTSFAKYNVFRKNKNKLIKQLTVWGKRWGQESMGYEHEGDLYYINKNFPVSQKHRHLKNRINQLRRRKGRR
jgi:hypothetical protein